MSNLNKISYEFHKQVESLSISELEELVRHKRQDSVVISQEIEYASRKLRALRKESLRK